MSKSASWHLKLEVFQISSKRLWVKPEKRKNTLIDFNKETPGEALDSKTEKGTIFWTQNWVPNHQQKTGRAWPAFAALAFAFAFAFAFGGMANRRGQQDCVKLNHFKMAAWKAFRQPSTLSMDKFY